MKKERKKCNDNQDGAYPHPLTSLLITNAPREDLEGRMMGLEENRERGGGSDDWREVRIDFSFFVSIFFLGPIFLPFFLVGER